MKTGILVASFGTTHLDTLEKTIVAVERDVAAAFPQAVCYRAFTSGMVRRGLKKKYDIAVDSVEEALERMKTDGVEQGVVLPTLVIPGDEYERLRANVLRNAGHMKVAMGLPLLWDDDDLENMVKTLTEAYPTGDDTVLLAMGHGTEHPCGCLYLRLAQRMQHAGMALCTVEGTPSFEDAICQLKEQGCRKAHLVPMLLVAGDHSKNDMVGVEEDSLRSLLERSGFEVNWTLQGLGEIPAVRERYVMRAKDAYGCLTKE